MPKIGMLLYGTGLILSIIGDAIHEKSPHYSGGPFDWGGHYTFTIPMMLAGWLLPPLTLIATLIIGLVYSRKNRIRQV